MNFKVSSQIFEKFPGLRIAVVRISNLDNTKKLDISNLMTETVNHIRENFETPTLSENPKIKCWRQAYSSFGAKPKKYKCSVEALLRRILSGQELPDISAIVNLYNFISVKHLIPAGGDDLDKVEGDIELIIAKGDEKYEEIGTKDLKSPKPGEVVYKDNKEVLCRRWNYRECDKTKMTEDSKNVAIVLEALAPYPQEDLEKAINEISSLVKQLGADVQTNILTQENPEVEL